ncbi:MAG: ZIP family metal transporter [Chitinophagaceae bacterium]|nr:ZIP family metal transporter [Chitinophagaceae bacterium]
MSHLVPNILLFLVSFLAGLLAMRVRLVDDQKMNMLLAFSGSFLLSITFLHLIPETIEDQGHKAGLYILIGFFLQLLIQRFTHGVEHGHSHIHSHNHHIPLVSILGGLGIHALMEGFPLGFNYRMPQTDTSLYFAVAIHKLPEIIIVATMIRATNGKGIRSWGLLLLFALLTPLASVLASYLGSKYFAISNILGIMIPIVAGAFIHIATTIFYESGTKQHTLTNQKIVAIVLGVALGAATLLMH